MSYGYRNERDWVRESSRVSSTTEIWGFSLLLRYCLLITLELVHMTSATSKAVCGAFHFKLFV